MGKTWWARKKGINENLNPNSLLTSQNMLQDVPEEFGLAEWLGSIEIVYTSCFFSKMDLKIEDIWCWQRQSGKYASVLPVQCVQVVISSEFCQKNFLL